MTELYVVAPLLVVGIVMALVRVARGPQFQDRVLALDLLANIGIAMIAVYATATDQPVILDVALLLALVSFLGTVAFAHYSERVFRS